MDKGLFSFENIGANSYQITLSSKSHPIFKAHFPQNPILPGFIYFHICEQIFGHKIVYIKKAKFISIAAPEDKLLLQYEIRDDQYITTFSCNGKKVCTISYKSKEKERLV